MKNNVFLGFRTLTADEVEVRAGNNCGTKGFTLLLYKDARVDQAILDETFGSFNWQRKHEIIDGVNYCTVSIKNPETGEWISKQDCGSESNIEAHKGACSDAFKRACSSWGIGRELYASPRIVIWNTSGMTNKDSYAVKEMTVESGRITHLVIINRTQKDAIAYQYTEPKATKQATVQPTTNVQKTATQAVPEQSKFPVLCAGKPRINGAQAQYIRRGVQELGKTEAEYCRIVHINSIEEIPALFFDQAKAQLDGWVAEKKSIGPTV